LLYEIYVALMQHVQLLAPILDYPLYEPSVLLTMKKKTENILLTALLILSIITIISVKILFANEPEKWDYGYETGEIFYNLSLAYIASLIFYLIVVTIPNQRNKKNINEHASRIVDRITYFGLGILHGLSTNIEDREKILTKNEFTELCKKIGPKSIKDYFASVDKQYPITYIQHLNSVKDNVKSEAQSLFIYNAHLDTELIKLINDILNCQFLTSLNSYFTDERYWHPTFEPVSFAFYEFYRKIALLKMYREKNM